MKMLFCPKCQDIKKFGSRKTFCKCKASWGKYKKDGLHSVIGGLTIPIGIDNGDFRIALSEDRKNRKYGPRFMAFVIPEPCPTVERED